MKKLLLLFLLSFIVIFSFAQFPTYQPVGSPTTLWDQKGAVRGTKGLINGSYTDTTVANADQIDFYPGAQIFTTSDDQIWVRDATATRWINVTTGFSPTPTCGLQSGTGIVTWDSLLVFDISPAIYSLCCDNIPRSTAQDSILLPPADPSNPVYVAIILDANGVNYVRGTPAANPSLPQLTDCQIALTYVLINAGDIVPANVSVKIIYDENYHPSEYYLTPGGVVADTANTIFPAHLTHSIDVGNIAGVDTLSFMDSLGTVSLNNYGVLKFYIRMKASTATVVRLVFAFFQDNVQQTGWLTVSDGIYGFSKNNVSGYQIISIPISAFTIIGTDVVNKMKIVLQGTYTGFYLDWVQLQAGLIQSGGIGTVQSVGAGSLPPLFTTSVTLANTFPLINFAQSTAAAYTIFANATNATALPTFTTINLSTPITTGLLAASRISPGNANDILTTIAGVATWVPSAGGYDTTFVVNGLHVIPGVTSDTLSLGGSLRENVTIATVASTLTISTATSTVNPLAVTSTTGNTITTSSTNGNLFYGVTTNGDGVQAFTTNGTGGAFVSVAGVGVAGQSTNGLAGSYTVTPSSTNTIVPVLQVNRATSGTAANGIGGSIDFVNQKITGGGTLSNRIISKWSNAVAANATSQLIFTGINNASPDTLMRLDGNGQLTLNQYTTLNFNGGVAADSVLVITSAGVVLKRDAASFGGTTATPDLQAVTDVGATTTNNITVPSLNWNGGGGTVGSLSSINILGDLYGQVQIGNELGGNGLLQTTTVTSTQTYEFPNMSGTVVVDAGNGLTDSSGRVILGGTLYKYTTIDVVSHGIGLYGNNSGSILSASNDGIGVAINAISVGTSISGLTNSTIFPALSAQVNSTTTNDVAPIAYIIRTVDGGTAANGIGGSIYFQTQTTTDGGRLANELKSILTDAADATRTSQFIITGVNSAVTGDILTLNGNKSIKANGYGSGTFTGTPAYSLQVDASGNIIEGTASGGVVSGTSLTLGYVAKTALYTLAASDFTVDATSGTWTATLPTAVGISGRIYTIKNSGAGVITVGTTSSQTIDGVTTATLGSQYMSITVQSNGANWIIINN